MSLYKTFKTSKSLEVTGVFIEYGPNSKGDPIRIKIARSGGGNEDFNKAFERATKPYRKAIAAGSLSNAVAEKLYKEVFAEHVVKGWENVEDESGNPLPYSKDAALKLLSDLPDLYADLKDQAGNLAIFREELLEADLGNSGTASATGGSKAA